MYKLYVTERKSGESSDFLIKKYIRQFLDKAGRLAPDEICITRNGNEKPRADVPGIFFSVSHSGDLWCCAVSDCEIGFDVQEERDCSRERLAKRFFHPDETAWLAKNDYRDFCRIWAYKESYVKYTGSGLTGGIDFFSVVNPESRTLCAPGVRQEEVHIKDGYFAVVTY